MSWIERGGSRVALDESPLTAAAIVAPDRQPLSPAAATAALVAAGRHLDLQVLAGATADQLDGTLAVMRGIHRQVASGQWAVAGRTAERRVAARRRTSGRIPAAA